MGIFIKNLALGPMNGITLIQLTLNFIGNNTYKRINLPLCSYLSCGLCKKCDGLGFRTNYTDHSSITCYNCPAKLVFFQKNFGNYSTPKRYEQLTFESHLAQLCGHMYIK
jgi:hypothetical protein